VRQPRSPSFPSSHAANAFGAATVAVVRLGRGWAWLALPALFLGLSRVYVGVHYPTDVAGGAALGILVGAAAGRLGGRLLERLPIRSRRSLESEPQDKVTERVAAGDRPVLRSASHQAECVGEQEGRQD